MSIHDVVEMHNQKGFAKHRLNKPGFLKEDFMQMRLNFAFEELVELGVACGFRLTSKEGFIRDKEFEPNLADAFDALIDKVYVDYGTADLMGLVTTGPYKVSRWLTGWTRVHKANMQKEMVLHPTESSRGFGIDLKKPKGWKKPLFGDILE